MKNLLDNELLDTYGYLYSYKEEYFDTETIHKMKKDDPENYAFSIGKSIYKTITLSENSAEFEAGIIYGLNFALTLLDKKLDK